MAFASKAAQRLERSTKGAGADSAVESSSVEMPKMGKSSGNLMGGKLGSGKPSGALRGGDSLGVSGTKSTLYGALGKDGGSTAKTRMLNDDSSRTKSGTTRESIGRTGETFSPRVTPTKNCK